MLTKKDRKKRYNKKSKVKSNFHLYDGWGVQSATAAKSAFSSGNLGGSIGTVAGGVKDIVAAGMDNAKIADTSEQEAEIASRQNWQSEATDNAGLLAEMMQDVALGDTSWKSIRGVTPGQMVGNTAKGMVSGAAAGAKVGGPWGAVIGAAAGLASGVAGIFAGNSKAKKKAAELTESSRKANYAKASTMTAKAGALDQASDQRAVAAYAAEGGKINPFPSSHFPSPVTEFNEGGSHESNPYDGIPQGIAPDGLPNLVEEGEVKYDNYIFSDRLMISKENKKKYKYLKGDTFADAAKRIKKDLMADERPNDPLALLDLEEQLRTLSFLQEEERAKKGLVGENRMMFSRGGHLFDGEGLYLQSNGNWVNLPEGYSARDIKRGLREGTIGYGSDPNNITTANNYNNGYTNRRNARLMYEAYGDTNDDDFNPVSALRSAPVVGNAMAALHQVFNRPDYEHAKELQQSEETVTPATYTPLTQKMTYQPFDTNYYGNKLGAQAGATRRAIREQTASNPYASTAALIAADASAQSQMGDLYKKAEEFNLAQREKVGTFNRATDSANAEMAMKAQQLNASLRDSALTRKLKRDATVAQMKAAEDAAWSSATSDSLTAMFDNMGEIGKEQMTQEQAWAKILSEGKLTPELKKYAESQIGQYYSSINNSRARQKSRAKKKLEKING